MTEAYIYDAIRTPRGKGKPDGSAARGHLAAALGRGARRAARPHGLPPDAVEDVIWGNVTQVGEQGGCLARSAVLASALGRTCPASRSTASAPRGWRR